MLGMFALPQEIEKIEYRFHLTPWTSEELGLYSMVECCCGSHYMSELTEGVLRLKCCSFRILRHDMALDVSPSSIVTEARKN